jgi:hypothetical protein
MRKDPINVTSTFIYNVVLGANVRPRAGSDINQRCLSPSARLSVKNKPVYRVFAFVICTYVCTYVLQT